MPVETLEPIKIEKSPKKEFDDITEEMAGEFLEKRFDCFKRVWKASNYDDENHYTDLIAEFKDGKRLAIQFSVTTDPVEQYAKVNEVLGQGTVELHDDYGNVIDQRETPLVMIHQDKIEWGKALNRYLEEKGESPFDYLPDEAETKKKFLEDMITSLKAQAMRHPGEKQIFYSRMEILEKELEEHLEAHKELVK